MPAVVMAAVVAVIAAWAVPVAAQLPPTRVFGTVTVDGQPAPPGTVVQALIGEKVCGEGLVRRVSDELPLGYVVDVQSGAQTPGCGDDGATIRFKVGGAAANEAGVFATGTFLRLNLTVSGQVATPTPGPTPPPFGGAATPTPASTPPAATATGTPSPTPGAAGSPAASATATGTVTATPSETPTSTPVPRFTVTPGSSVTAVPAAGESSGGGNGAAVALVVGIVVIGAAGAAAYWYLRGRAGR